MALLVTLFARRELHKFVVVDPFSRSRLLAAMSPTDLWQRENVPRLNADLANPFHCLFSYNDGVCRRHFLIQISQKVSVCSPKSSVTVPSLALFN
jgi:hypothetical protein